MPRTRLALLLCVLGLLAAPAAASAATWTVDDDAAAGCGGADRTCRTLTEAAAAVAANDRIEVAAGRYDESVTFADDGLTIVGLGANPRAITVVGAAGSAITLDGAGQTLRNLTVIGSTGSAITADGAGGTIDGVIAGRVTAGADAPSVDVNAATTITRGLLLHAPATGNATTPAVQADADVTLVGQQVISAKGPALRVVAAGTHAVTRSGLFGNGASSHGIEVLSANAGVRTLTIDSSFVSGGANAAGVRAETSCLLLVCGDDIQITARHLTTARQGEAFDLVAGTAEVLLDAAGSIQATVQRSIAHPASTADEDTAGPLSTNDAVLTFTDSDTPPGSGDGDITRTGLTSNTPDAQLFVDPEREDLHLLATAPVIDTIAAAALAGASATDVDGNPRRADGPDANTAVAEDKGADEWFDRPPVARLSATPTTVRTGSAVAFDASASSDPDTGDRIIGYRFDFGDGQRVTTTEPKVRHAYARAGTYRARVTVVDRQFVPARSAPVAITVTAPPPDDGDDDDPTGPTAQLLRPKDGQTLRLFRSVRRNGRRVRIGRPLVVKAKGGPTARFVQVSVRRPGTVDGRCRYLNDRGQVKDVPCDEPLWFNAERSGTSWTFRTRSGRRRIKPGRYQVRVRAIDDAGQRSSGFSVEARTLANIRLR